MEQLRKLRWILVGLVIDLRVAIRLTGLFANGQTVLLGNSLPRLKLSVCPVTFVLELVVGRTKLCDGLLGEELLQRPLLDGSLLLLPELRDIADRVLQNGAFILLTSRNDLSQLIDAFIDGLTTATLDCPLLAATPKSDTV